MKIIDRDTQSLTTGKFADLNIATRQTKLTRQTTGSNDADGTQGARLGNGYPSRNANSEQASPPSTNGHSEPLSPDLAPTTFSSAPKVATDQPANNATAPTPETNKPKVPIGKPNTPTGEHSQKPGTSKIGQIQTLAATAPHIISALNSETGIDDISDAATNAYGNAGGTAARKTGQTVRKAGNYVSRQAKAARAGQRAHKAISGAPRSAKLAHRLGMRITNVANISTAALRRVATVITVKLTGAAAPVILAVIAVLAALLLVLAVLPTWLVNHLTTTVTGTGIPAQYQAIVARAGAICDDVPPNLVAGIIEQESGWDQDVVSTAGAVGIAQFMPQWWPEQGKRAAGDGKPADINDPQDQIWSLGNNMCENFRLARTYLDEGWVTGTEIELALAIYNAGQGNVLRYGGVPPFPETQNYVIQVPNRAAEYLGTPEGSYAGDSGTITAEGTAIVNEARRYLGVPYVWGGETPSGLDCSGLVTIVYRAAGIEVPHHADTAAKSGQGTTIPEGQWQPGDVVYFRYHGASVYHHTAIYAGNGKIVEAVTFGVPLGENNLPTHMEMFAKRYL